MGSIEVVVSGDALSGQVKSGANSTSSKNFKTYFIIWVSVKFRSTDGYFSVTGFIINYICDVEIMKVLPLWVD